MTTTTPAKKRVLLVEDHPIVSQGLALLINQQPDLTVCDTADEPNSALQKIETIKPDLVVTDITLKNGNGIDLVKSIKSWHPKTPVLVLSMHDENLYAIRALRAGSCGYVMKQVSSEEVIKAIRAVLAGEIYISPAIEKRMRYQLIGARTPKTGSPLEDLTDRELEVFGFIGKGFATRQIAETLHLSVKTIESHRAHIKEKLNLKNATELVQHAIQWTNS